MEDAHIVDLYWARSQTAVAETAKKYGTYCYSIAHAILTNPEDAEESVNDTWLDAWNSMPPHRPAILATFLGKITRRIAIDNRYTYRPAARKNAAAGNCPWRCPNWPTVSRPVKRWNRRWQTRSWKRQSTVLSCPCP